MRLVPLLALLAGSACQLVAVPAATCTPSTCGGCCDAYDVCQAGTSTSACGASGVACGTCGAGLSCALGSCGAVATGGGKATGGGAGGGTGGGVVGTGGGSARAWVKLSVASSPTARSSHSMAYDSTRHRVVVFGGETGDLITEQLADTWEFDGTTWARAATTGPSARQFAAMDYDPERKQMILFGGLAGSTRMADTWAWSGSGWTSLSPATSPPARSSGRLAWDVQLKALVLFGGTSANTSSPYLSDLWKWTGTDWEPVPSTGTIPGRSQASFAYDPSRKLFVAFGGTTAAALGETWQLSEASAWSKLSPATNPSARYGSQMAYDGRSKTMMIFGGFDAQTYDSDFWSYTPDGTWAALTGGPAARGYHGLVRDTLNDRLVLFGGEDLLSYFDDTWVY